MERPAIPDDWLDFYMWAVGEADRECEGQPETQLITNEGDSL